MMWSTHTGRYTHHSQDVGLCTLDDEVEDLDAFVDDVGTMIVGTTVTNDESNGNSSSGIFSFFQLNFD